MRRRIFVIVIGGVLALPLIATAPSAQEPAGGVVLILDASGSMNRTDDAGVRLIDGAKEALQRLISALPEGTPVGLRVYGHRVPNTDKARGCTDTESIVPVGPLDRAQMSNAIDGFGARGFTPIGLSLREAATDLPGSQGVVVLVSDGEDTCAPPDPCEVAGELVAEGIDVRLHTVGFLLDEDDPARAQLQCIAEAGGGTYREVAEVEPLAAELGRIIQLEGLTEGLEGQFVLPVSGGFSMQEATLLEAGDLSGAGFSTVIRPGQQQWFAYDLDGFYAVMVYATPEELRPGGGTISARVLDASGEDVHLPMDSRFGVSRVDLTADGWLPGLGITVNLMGFDVPWEANSDQEELLTYLGYDETSYQAAFTELLTRPEPEQHGAGRYYVVFDWDAPADDTEYDFGFGLSGWPHEDVKHMRYRRVDGALTAAEASRLQPPDAGLTWLAPSEEIAKRGGFTGVIERGETRWYQVTTQVDEAVAVRAFLNRPIATDTGPGETFSIDLVTPDGRSVAAAHLDRPMSAALDDPASLDDPFLPRGLAPRRLIGAAATWLGEGTGPPAGAETVAIGFTWDGADDGATAELEFLVSAYGGLRQLPPPPPEPEGPTVQEETAVTTEPPPPATTSPPTTLAPVAAPGDSEDSGGSSPLVFALIGLAALAVGGGALLIRRRSR